MQSPRRLPARLPRRLPRRLRSAAWWTAVVVVAIAAAASAVAVLGGTQQRIGPVDAHLSVPHPTIDLHGALKLFGQLKSFFTSPTGLLDEQSPQVLRRVDVAGQAAAHRDDGDGLAGRAWRRH